MTQYEIELRDKYFEKSLDVSIVYNRDHRDFDGAHVIDQDTMIENANNFADKCMAERQKHLDTIMMKQKPIVYVDEDPSFISSPGEAIPHPKRIQGMECDK